MQTLSVWEPGDPMSDLGANNRQGPCREGEEPKPTMNGRGKSDPAIVAVKLANNAGKPVAESMEPRAGAEGNADQQTTCRAQNRESVSHALERIREVARHKKKEKFTSLLHHVVPEMLRTAVYALKRDAAPGVDGMTWDTYEQGLDRRIETLHARVQSGVGAECGNPARSDLCGGRSVIDRPYREQHQESSATSTRMLIHRKVVFRLVGFAVPGFVCHRRPNTSAISGVSTTTCGAMAW